MFNITESDDLKVWFTTDPHLDHQGPKGGTPLWESRGYESPDDMTLNIIDTCNEIVRPNDILFMLGDLCLNSNPLNIDRYLGRLKCQNFWCLWGNHNNPHEKLIYRPGRDKLLAPGVKANWVYPVTYKNMTYLGHYHEVVVNGQFIVLSHYAYQVWNESHHSSWCLCGHSHGSLATTRPESDYGKILDVGWDLFKKPLSFQEIKEIMDKKPIQKVDHH